ncbi:hypothetical protein LguiA_013521 [Lonicera macranthoides]
MNRFLTNNQSKKSSNGLLSTTDFCNLKTDLFSTKNNQNKKNCSQIKQFTFSFSSIKTASKMIYINSFCSRNFTAIILYIIRFFAAEIAKTTTYFQPIQNTQQYRAHHSRIHRQNYTSDLQIYDSKTPSNDFNAQITLSRKKINLKSLYN